MNKVIYINEGWLDLITITSLKILQKIIIEHWYLEIYIKFNK